MCVALSHAAKQPLKSLPFAPPMLGVPPAASWLGSSSEGLCGGAAGRPGVDCCVAASPVVCDVSVLASLMPVTAGGMAEPGGPCSAFSLAASRASPVGNAVLDG